MSDNWYGLRSSWNASSDDGFGEPKIQNTKTTDTEKPGLQKVGSFQQFLKGGKSTVQSKLKWKK